MCECVDSNSNVILELYVYTEQRYVVNWNFYYWWRFLSSNKKSNSQATTHKKAELRLLLLLLFEKQLFISPHHTSGWRWNFIKQQLNTDRQLELCIYRRRTSTTTTKNKIVYEQRYRLNVFVYCITIWVYKMQMKRPSVVYECGGAFVSVQCLCCWVYSILSL